MDYAQINCSNISSSVLLIWILFQEMPFCILSSFKIFLYKHFKMTFLSERNKMQGTWGQLENHIFGLQHKWLNMVTCSEILFRSYFLLAKWVDLMSTKFWIMCEKRKRHIHNLTETNTQAQGNRNECLEWSFHTWPPEHSAKIPVGHDSVLCRGAVPLKSIQTYSYQGWDYGYTLTNLITHMMCKDDFCSLH